MPEHLAVVADGFLYLPNDPDDPRIAVDSAEWFAWLEQPATRSFAFRQSPGGFTARKERRQRGAHYWIAYRKVAGRLRNVYLGKSTVLTHECLARTAQRLADPTPPHHVGTLATAPPAHPRPPGLLATKLYIPSPPSRMLPRSRLVDQLQLGVARKLTLISAPGGFGKTTLVSGWRTTSAGAAVPLAWVSLDATDRDPTRFWSYVSAAIDQVLPGGGTDALALLTSARPPAIELVLHALLNALSALPGDAVLVLEDYHTIDVAPIHEGVAFLLDHLPPRLHLVIMTRADPPLPLASLRARGELVEVRAADLRFTFEEATRFLAEAMDLALSATEVALLAERTEGWIAGLQFAALALRGQTETGAFVAAFSGSHRFVMDYLIEEVLTRQPAHLQHFLLHTAILERLCGPLCDAVMLGAAPPGPSLPTASPLMLRDDAALPLAASHAAPSLAASFSQAVLDDLERRNLFLVALDDNRGWYRYHHLFADVLRQRLLSGAGPEFVAALHSRAATWLEQAGLPVEAMEHALAASDWSHAARMIDHYGTTYIFQGQVGLVLHWLGRLPESFVRSAPRLCLIAALGLGDMGQLDAAETHLQAAERSAHRDGPGAGDAAILGEVALIRAMLARSRGDIERCVALSHEALLLLPPSEAAQRAAAMLNLARSYLQDGDVTAPRERLAFDAIGPVRASGNRLAYLSALTNHARIQVLQGRLHVAAAAYRRAAEIPAGPGGLKALGSGAAAYYVGLSRLQYEWNELHLAEANLAAGMELLHGPLTIDADVVTLGYTTQARVHHARGERAAARAALHALVAVARERGFAPHVAVAAAALEARLALADGDLEFAGRWASECRPALQCGTRLVYHMERAVLARVRIAEWRAASTSASADDLDTTLRLLHDLAVDAEANGRMGHVIEALTLSALALDALGDGGGAQRALERALLLAAPAGYVRSFIDEGVPAAVLLRRARRSRVAPAYITRLLRALHTGLSGGATPSEPGPSPALPAPRMVLEPPTRRELDVLRLIAAGKSNAEIAQTLVIAVSTVRTHTNNLFGKLAATRRTEAVARARELGLL